MSTTTTTYVELVRVSTTGQADRGTPEAQRTALDALAKSRPGTRIARIEALGVSGALPIAQTEQGRQLMQLAEAGFTELRLWDCDRALGSRCDDPVDRLALLSLARQAGAIIVDASGREIDPATMAGELEVYLRGLFASTERHKLRERTRAGKRRMAAAGKLATGKPPYGYRWTGETFEIIEAEAEVVRAIFAMAAEGASVYGIRDQLNARGMRSPRGKQWGRSTIAWTLRQTAYTGQWEHVGGRADLPPIVAESTWQAVQHALEQRKGRGRATWRPTSAAVQGRIWHHCGARAYVRPRHGVEYGVCSTLRSPNPCPTASKTFRLDAVDEVVWEMLRDAITSGDLLDRAADRGGDGASDAREQVASCNRNLDRLVKSELRTLSLAEDGLLTDRGLRAKLKEIAAQRAILERTRAIAEAQVRSAASMAADTRAVAARIDELRERVGIAGPEERRAVIALLVPDAKPYGITIQPDGSVDVYGVLGAAREANEGSGTNASNPSSWVAHGKGQSKFCDSG